MPLFDASRFAGDLAGWKSELGARIQDILARKSIPVTTKLSAIVRKIEGAVSTATLKGAVSDLVSYFRKEAKEAPVDLAQVRDIELELFLERIRASGRKDSIENYCAYVVTVDVSL